MPEIRAGRQRASWQSRSLKVTYGMRCWMRSACERTSCQTMVCWGYTCCQKGFVDYIFNVSVSVMRQHVIVLKNAFIFGALHKDRWHVNSGHTTLCACSSFITCRLEESVSSTFPTSVLFACSQWSLSSNAFFYKSYIVDWELSVCVGFIISA